VQLDNFAHLGEWFDAIRVVLCSLAVLSLHFAGGFVCGLFSSFFFLSGGLIDEATGRPLKNHALVKWGALTIVILMFVIAFPVLFNGVSAYNWCPGCGIIDCMCARFCLLSKSFTCYCSFDPLGVGHGRLMLAFLSAQQHAVLELRRSDPKELSEGPHHWSNLQLHQGVLLAVDGLTLRCRSMLLLLAQLIQNFVC
jgi:hypothetical protein